jgi:glycosyltransferase involved in cell wall biosynthesis
VWPTPSTSPNRLPLSKRPDVPRPIQEPAILTASILYEAFNLTRRDGTGIKTYVSNLARTASALGYMTLALLSTERSLNRKDPLLAEVSFFDARRSNSRVTKYFRDPLHFLVGSPFGIATTMLPRTGTVIDPLEGAASQKSFQELHVARRFTDMARHHFKRYHRSADLQLSTTPTIFHASHAIPLKVRGAINIYTIHDIVPLRLPYATLDNKKYFLETVRHLCRQADHIVTVSEHSRRDIMSLFGISEDRITNTFQAVNIPHQLLAQSDDEASLFVERVFGLDPQSYFLFYGALEPKKNVSRLIDAYAASGVERPLVIVGGLGWGYDDTVAQIDQDHFSSYRITADRITREKKVRRLDHVAFPSLVALIRCARAVLFPSLYEGFGLPILEAMTLGTPVMTSNTSSTPEVAGDAAILVDPLDVGAMARVIRTLDADTDLCAELSNRGRLQAQKFSPEAYSRKIAELYGRLMG